ncbi:hypothetical protein CO054_00465 [Candidatus Shapirobacteria bacterium CG_4_9_14_0_2_um_filter_39_11]|uniref:Uncharacterized protein n=1 Tax=Candidatus Shapirobacteria bacterium CG_4_9_14_0_2_um_filter_39_11 TaxID=1974478 RepID=A0A2M8ETD1_9BACT|nr:MAG: hypothetical protein CO054_00465 [Candidatus Shapirobacteria bacterium CG_4_9_14_0_2_um_filter_39_11]
MVFEWRWREVSPVRIEACGDINCSIKAGELTNPAVKIDKSGNEYPIGPNQLFLLSEREVLIIRDVSGTVTVETEDPAVTISKEGFPNPSVSRRVDAIRIQGEAEGWILPQKGERQSLQKLYFCSAGDLEKNPITVLTEKGEIVKIFWEEE